MAKKFELTEERKQQIKTYNEIGWPASMTIPVLELYEQMSITTIRTHFLSRPDAPYIKFDQRGGVIPRMAWEKFKASMSVGQTYHGEI